ncbi:MAG: diguanylate cyclase response regulator [Rhodocyclales bacterium GWA2_65_20]|nr:MAG: diguanylate cyclase response regulator [Rhodocyclales bacterium GWA2_65_20]
MTQHPHAKPSILIVDDTPTNIQVLAETLRADYRVKVATGGQAALDIVAAGKPDLILLDVMMTGMDGYEVCRRLKDNPDTQGIPVIFVTARCDTQDEEHGLRLGAMDYITKPFSPAIVRARVRNHISLKMNTDLLESLALIDSLTGVPNRRRFDETLDAEWKRGLRSGTPLAVIMADIDCFKAYNDHYGHGAGDECLRAVAQALSDSLARPADVMARYGGEEFVAVMPDTDGAGAKLLAQRWCDNVAALALPHTASSVAGHVTVSVGYASQTPAAERSPQMLQGMADSMLYEAKKQGRNRICGLP